MIKIAPVEITGEHPVVCFVILQLGKDGLQKAKKKPGCIKKESVMFVQNVLQESSLKVKELVNGLHGGMQPLPFRSTDLHPGYPTVDQDVFVHIE